MGGVRGRAQYISGWRLSWQAADRRRCSEVEGADCAAGDLHGGGGRVIGKRRMGGAAEELELRGRQEEQWEGRELFRCISAGGLVRLRSQLLIATGPRSVRAPLTSLRAEVDYGLVVGVKWM